MGVIVGVAILRGLTTFNIMFGQAIAKTGQANLFLTIENMALGALLLLFMIKKPRGLIPEKQLYIPGINYKSIVMSGGMILRRLRNALKSLSYPQRNLLEHRVGCGEDRYIPGADL